jgi:Protein of unknown function (DUF2971)
MTLLYKFFAEPKSEETKYLSGILSSQEIHASNPYKFNDPFEFKVALDLDADEDTHRRHFLKAKSGATEAEFQSWRRGLPAAKWSIEQETRAALLGTVGVACFTRNWNNELLWAHYAKNHTGFCVGFDEEALTSWGEVTGFGDVVYTKDVPVFNPFKQHKDDFARMAMFHKSLAWSYEEEYRLLFSKSGMVRLPGEAIREIIIGCRAPANLRERARAFAGEAVEPVVFQAAEDLRKFTFSREVMVQSRIVMTSHF